MRNKRGFRLVDGNTGREIKVGDISDKLCINMRNKRGFKLVDGNTGREIKVGDKVRTFRGEDGYLEDWVPPYDWEVNQERGARIYFRYTVQEGYDSAQEYFPSVIGAKIVKI